jgi:hypothetical protein
VLFLQTIRVLYTDAAASAAPALRAAKPALLRAFQRDGFFLVDACEKPMPRGASAAVKRRRISNDLPSLRARLSQLRAWRIPLVLIAATVHDAAAGELAAAGYNVVNIDAIAFPSYRWAKQFRAPLDRAIRAAGWRPRLSGAL